MSPDALTALAAVGAALLRLDARLARVPPEAGSPWLGGVDLDAVFAPLLPQEPGADGADHTEDDGQRPANALPLRRADWPAVSAGSQAPRLAHAPATNGRKLLRAQSPDAPGNDKPDGAPPAAAERDALAGQAGWAGAPVRSSGSLMPGQGAWRAAVPDGAAPAQSAPRQGVYPVRGAPLLPPAHRVEGAEPVARTAEPGSAEPAARPAAALAVPRITVRTVEQGPADGGNERFAWPSDRPAAHRHAEAPAESPAVVPTTRLARGGAALGALLQASVAPDDAAAPPPATSLVLPSPTVVGPAEASRPEPTVADSASSRTAEVDVDALLQELTDRVEWAYTRQYGTSGG